MKTEIEWYRYPTAKPPEEDCSYLILYKHSYYGETEIFYRVERWCRCKQLLSSKKIRDNEISYTYRWPYSWDCGDEDVIAWTELPDYPKELMDG